MSSTSGRNKIKVALSFNVALIKLADRKAKLLGLSRSGYIEQLIRRDNSLPNVLAA